MSRECGEEIREVVQGMGLVVDEGGHFNEVYIVGVNRIFS